MHAIPRSAKPVWLDLFVARLCATRPELAREASRGLGTDAFDQFGDLPPDVAADIFVSVKGIEFEASRR